MRTIPIIFSLFTGLIAVGCSIAPSAGPAAAGQQGTGDAAVAADGVSAEGTATETATGDVASGADGAAEVSLVGDSAVRTADTAGGDSAGGDDVENPPDAVKTEFPKPEISQPEVNDTGVKPSDATGGTCVGFCGAKSAGACYCDNACTGAGDCCADYQAVCGGTSGGPSCVGKCGGKGSGNCYCDDQCEQLGDCCPDFKTACGGGTGTTETCAGKCGGKSAGKCYCDTSCKGAGDCCADFAEKCPNIGPGDIGPTDGGPKPDAADAKTDTNGDAMAEGTTDAALDSGSDATSTDAPLPSDATDSSDGGTTDTVPAMTCATASQSTDKFWLCPPLAGNVGALHGQPCGKDSECLYGLCLFGLPLAGYDSKIGVCSKNCGYADGGAAATCGTENTLSNSFVCVTEKAASAGNTKQNGSLPSTIKACGLTCETDVDCAAWNPALPNCFKASTAELSVPLQGVCAKLP